MHTGDSKIQGYSLVCNKGKKTSKAMFSVKLNGHQTVDKLEVNGPTPHGFKGPETADGPIWFEAFGRRVIYRNIWVVERP